jgi:hypothetical protein
MQTVKSVFGVTRALLPVLYCGGLVFYFMRAGGGSFESANMIGLGPTIVGLAAVGFLLCIPLILRVGKLFNGPPAAGSGPHPKDDDDDAGFDADAAIARYMASKRAEESVTGPPVSRPAPRPASNGGGPARPTGFGRRVS